MDLSTTELALLVLVGLASGTYAKSEGCSPVLAAVIGVGAAVIVYLVSRG